MPAEEGMAEDSGREVEVVGSQMERFWRRLAGGRYGSDDLWWRVVEPCVSMVQGMEEKESSGAMLGAKYSDRNWL